LNPFLSLEKKEKRSRKRKKLMGEGQETCELGRGSPPPRFRKRNVDEKEK
jgi:hypothetical protein